MSTTRTLRVFPPPLRQPVELQRNAPPTDAELRTAEQRRRGQ